MPPRRPSLPQVAVIIFLAAILISEALLYDPGVQEHLTFDAQFSSGGGYVNETDRVSSTFSANLVRSDLLVSPASSVTTVYFYFDSAYPTSFSVVQYWYGLSQHLQAVASQRNTDLNLVYVNASGLRDLLDLPPASGSVLVMASGVLPYTVYTNTSNFVLPWIREGGDLIWLGARIGSFSGKPNQPAVWPSPLDPGVRGEAEFIDPALLGSNASWFLNQSVMSAALGLNYSYGESGDDLNLTLVQELGGTPLGSEADGYTNLAVLPIGSGRLIYFGAPVFEALDQLSQTILNGLDSGVFLGNFTLLASTAFFIGAGHSLTLSESFALSRWAYEGTLYPRLCAFAFQTNYLGFFASTQCVGVPYD